MRKNLKEARRKAGLSEQEETGSQMVAAGESLNGGFDSRPVLSGEGLPLGDKYKPLQHINLNNLKKRGYMDGRRKV